LAKLQKATISFVMSACPFVHPSVFPHGRILASIGRITKKFDICVFFENLSRKFNFH